MPHQVSLLRLCVVRVAKDGGREAVRALFAKYSDALQAPIPACPPGSLTTVPLQPAQDWKEWMVLQAPAS